MQQKTNKQMNNHILDSTNAQRERNIDLMGESL